MGARLYQSRWWEPTGLRQRREIQEYEAQQWHFVGFEIICNEAGQPTHYQEVWEPGLRPVRSGFKFEEMKP